jgi:hypothetical protein
LDAPTEDQGDRRDANASATANRAAASPDRTNARSGSVGFDELDGVANGLNSFCGVIGNLDTELFLESHHEFDCIKAIRAKIVYEACFLGNLLVGRTQMLDNDLLNAFRDVTHF